MRYLKKFNESSITSDISNIKDLSNNHLSYLVDKGFKIDIDSLDYEWGKNVTIDIRRDLSIWQQVGGGKQIKNLEFDYIEIKDHFIPFIHMLNKEYDLSKRDTIKFQLPLSKDLKFYTIKCVDILNDNIESDFKLVRIILKINF